MSRTHKKSKGLGEEYWSRRFPIPLTPGRIGKWLTKRRERRLERELLHRAQREEESDG